MPQAVINGIRLNYDETGAGPVVVLVAGTGSRGRTWHLYQVPALVAAGYRVVTFDNRGMHASDTPPGPMRIEDLVADVAGLIDHCGPGRCHLIGTSLGAQVVAELALVRPELVGRTVLMATRARPDALSRAACAAERAWHDSGVDTPATYDAVVRAMQNLSPRTLTDDVAVTDWLDIFELSAGDERQPGVRAQLDVEMVTDRRADYAGIRAPTLVVGFADDLIAPPVRCREVAEAIRGAAYVEVDDAGHYGYLERPDQVNAHILKFLAEDSRGEMT